MSRIAPVLATLGSLAALGCLAALGGCGGEPPREADPTSRRSLADGEVVGFEGGYGHHAWLGISFARPPVGELRWRAPQPNFPWSEARQALEHGPWCPQLASPFAGYDAAPAGTPVGDEDCLYLDVYAPRATPAAVPRGRDARPVMVWIHGGGNVVGGAPFYDGGHLAVAGEVVVVVLQYRLGPLGWFRHASLRGPGTTAADRSGNFGLLDQIRALEWVRDNIAAFGGDPGRVTIFGESAGARDVFALLLSARARGLFHRAIVQSGGTDLESPEQGEALADASRPGHRNSSNEVLARLLVAQGEADDRDQALRRISGFAAEEAERFLRGTSAEELLEAYVTEDLEGLIDVPQMFRDGAVLPAADGLEWIARGGTYNRVPVMLGTTRDENKIFLFANPEWVRRILWTLPRLRDPELFEATAFHLARMWKATGADGPATALRRQQGDGVWVYRFDWDEEPKLFFVADLGQMLGASHGFEIPFVFGHWDLGREARVLFDSGNRPGREELSAKIISYWANFAYGGDPGTGRSGELPEWKPWDPRPQAEKFAVLDTEADGGVRMASDGPLTPEGVLAEVDRDPRLADLRRRCTVYYQLARHSRGFGLDEYPTAGSEGCAAYPAEGYPWTH